MFHALTGCNTLSSFAKRGKKSARAIWEGMTELTKAPMLLSYALRDMVPDDIMCIIKWFVILLYDLASKCTDIEKARRKLFERTMHTSSLQRRQLWRNMSRRQ